MRKNKEFYNNQKLIAKTHGLKLRPCTFQLPRH